MAPKIPAAGSESKHDITADSLVRSMAEFAPPFALDEFERRRAKLARHIHRSTERLTKAQNLRLWTVAVFFILLGIGSTKPSWRAELVAVPLFILIFPFEVRVTRQHRRFSQGLKGLETFYQRQQRRAQGLPLESAESVTKKEPKNRSSSQLVINAASVLEHSDPKLLARLESVSDLGILGAHSLITLINETFTQHGLRRILTWLDPEPAAVDKIVERQRQIQSLRGSTWAYTRITLIAEQARLENPDLHQLKSDQLLEFIKQPFLPPTFRRNFSIALILWIAAIVTLCAWSVGFGPSPLLPLVLFATFNFWAIGETGSTFKRAVDLELHLSVLEPVFARLERQHKLNSKLRVLFPETILNNPARASRRLAWVMGVLGVDTNPLLALILNVFLPWRMVGNFALEYERESLMRTLPSCIYELAEFEALGSLLILDRYQTRQYPTFLKSSQQANPSGSELSPASAMPESSPVQGLGPMRGGEFSPDFSDVAMRGIFHPLIARDKVVANDFSFDRDKHCGLLTGSNMAGKSTFLRTIGVNQMLAQMGAPVFARHLETLPVKVQTCIEVSDSLRDGFSYFYAEVRRLKEVLLAAQSKQFTLYLIDEIFRGTNNRERHIGSKSVIQQLASRANAFGFVSTHDLDLVKLESPQNAIENLHFRENFENGKMIFYYRLHKGPCPTSNALKIMQAEGIVITES